MRDCVHCAFIGVLSITSMFVYQIFITKVYLMRVEPRLCPILNIFIFCLNFDSFQVSYQFKVLMTAIFAVIILRKKLLVTQWTSLLFLITGIALVQLSSDDQKSSSGTRIDSNQNGLLGFSAVMGACVLSGFAGIFFEKMLKGADVSIWMRNIQMSSISIPLGIIVCVFKEGDKIAAQNFFHGYDCYVAYLIALNAFGGLLVAVVVKYADNILKGFATSLAIFVTCVLSIFIFDFHLTMQFSAGALLVIVAIFMYGYVPEQTSKPEMKVSNPYLDQIDGEIPGVDEDDENAKLLNV